MSFYNIQPIQIRENVSNGPDIEILVSEFTTFESARISISVPKQNQITKVNRPNLMKCIRKKCPMLGSN